jgi:hypothetical protein
MQAKSFLGEKRGAVRHFYATVIRGEVSDSSAQGYLRAASQIEEIWQQIDERLATLISQGNAPWEAYAQLRYPLAFIRAARTYQVFVQELLAADAAFDPQTAGYLPPITYDQANALCSQMQPALQYAIAALNTPSYVPDVPLPLILGPRIENAGRPCPVTHLQGIIAATREVREWAAGLLAAYQHAVNQATTSVPAEITAHITLLQSLLAQADSQSRFGTDFAGQVTQGQATPDMHMQAENSLWDALQNYFLLNQAVAIPEVLRAAQSHRPVSGPGTASRAYRDLRISPEDLWRYSAPSARAELYGTEFGSREMGEMWRRMGGILTAGAQQYLDEVDAALARNDVYVIAAMANCPYEPIYRTRRPLDIGGTTVPADVELHWNFHTDQVEYTQRFGRTGNWQEHMEEDRGPRRSSC